MNNDNPILNSPCEEPKLHYHTNDKGELDNQVIKEGKRIFIPDMSAIPLRPWVKKEIFDLNHDQKIAVRVISQFGKESMKVLVV